ncbi:MAG: dihydrodipicolinate synthase family protein, partial [Burkholderiales bacterium]|nr:dihydrodipicolinate synthase family protein [Burkholderiales bacterium]
MIVPTPRFGLSCALTTPFGTDGRCDVAKLAAHARSRIAAGCTSVTVFGTTGEGPSLSAATRAAVLGALPGAGLDPARDIVFRFDVCLPRHPNAMKLTATLSDADTIEETYYSVG